MFAHIGNRFLHIGNRNHWDIDIVGCLQEYLFGFTENGTLGTAVFDFFTESGKGVALVFSSGDE